MPSRRSSPPGCGLTHTVTHTRKGTERAGCGRRPPGGKLGGDSGGIPGERGGSMTGGCGKGWWGSRGGTVYDVDVPCSGGWRFPALFALGLSLSMR